MTRRRILLHSLALLFISFIFKLALAATPSTMHYQGYLTDTAGSPLGTTINISFRLYNVDAGGIALWQNTLSVPVDKGLFNVELGANMPFPSDLFDNPLWIGIEVETDGEMSPRKAVTSVGFAFRAQHVEIDADTLANLNCSAGQLAKFDGTSWDCAEDTVSNTLCSNGDILSCYTGPVATLNVGVCVTGYRLCSAGIFSSCLNEELPSAEICDGLDNNCDTVTDEGCTGECISDAECTDGLACTQDLCDIHNGTCTNNMTTATCLIDAACYAEGSISSSGCGQCASLTSQTSWTALPDGTQCGPNSVCADGSCIITSCASDFECDINDFCDQTNQCVPDLVNSSMCSRDAQCVNNACSDGFCCDTACNASCESCSMTGMEGTCSVFPAGTDPDNECSPYMCSGSAYCNTSCQGDNDCSAGSYCDSNLCLATLSQGAACNQNSQCSSTSCVDGFCCDSSCSGTCEACAGSITGTADGSCAFISAGTDPDNECSGAAVCSGTGMCIE